MTRSYKNYFFLNRNLGLRLLSPERGSPRILFFPYVGGHSLSFKMLAGELPGAWELWAVDPPGHGWAGGQLVDDFSEIVDLYLCELQHLFRDEFYLYGHSLGGLVAFRLAQLLMERNTSQPAGVFLGAAPVPHRISEYEHLRGKEMNQLVDMMAEFGGIPEALADNKDFLSFFFTPVRADIKVFLSSSIQREPGFNVPVTVLYSKEDRFIPHENIYEWDIYGENVCFKEVEGNHIFIQTHCSRTANVIKDTVSGISAGYELCSG